MPHYIITFILSSLILSSCANLSTERRVAGYEGAITSKSQIAVLPANAIINSLDVSGKKERQDNYEYYVEDIINSLAPEHLNKIGFRAEFISKSLLHSSKLSREYSMIIDEFRENKSKMYKTISIDAKLAHDWKDDAFYKLNSLGSKFNNELYAIFEYEGLVLTTGAMTMNALTSGLSGSQVTPHETYIMFLCIADGVKSKILWCNAYYSDIPVGAGITNLFKPKKVKEENHIRMMLDGVLTPIKKLRNG